MNLYYIVYSKSKTSTPPRTLSSTLVSVLPTFTEPLRKLTDLRSELSGVESLLLTVTVVLLKLSSGKYYNIF